MAFGFLVFGFLVLSFEFLICRKVVGLGLECGKKMVKNWYFL